MAGSPWHLLQRTAVSHDPLMKPAPNIINGPICTGQCICGYVGVCIWIRRNCSFTFAVIGFLAEMLVLMTGGVLTRYVQMLTGHVHVIRMVTLEEMSADL